VSPERLAGVLTVAVAAAAAGRQLADVQRLRRGTAAPVGPATWTVPGAQGRLAARLDAWSPRPVRSSAGRWAAAAWVAPLTVTGALLARAGGAVCRWDDRLGCYVARGVGGPSGWLLGRLRLDANAVGQVVLCRSTQPSARLLAHEAVHVRQAERLGALLLPVYVGMTARYGYRENPLERAARREAVRFGIRP
jgi:hypothetical protein